MSNANLASPSRFGVRLNNFRALFPLTALFMIFQPPVTWSEIFFLASLKRTPLTNAFPIDGTDWQTLDGQLLFHKAPYSSPWLMSLNTALTEALNNLPGRLFDALIGESGLVAHRLMGLGIALFCFACLFPLLSRNSSQAQHAQNIFPGTHGPATAENSSTATHEPATALLRLSPFTAAFFLLLLVRLGAIEQLFFIAGLALLARMPSFFASSKDGYPKFRQFFLSLLAALAFACTNSRGWIYPLAISAGVWTVLHLNIKAAALRSISIATLTFCIFSTLFLSLSDVQSFVSHLTQRWLYLNEPRYLNIQWPGSSLLWSLLSLWFALQSLQRLIAWLFSEKRTSPASFIELLCLSAAINFAHFQKTPQAVDLLLLSAIFFSVHRQSTCLGEALAGWKKLLHRVSQRLPRIYSHGLWLGLLLGLSLVLLPGTQIVLPLRVVLAATEKLLIDHPILCIASACLLLASIYAAVKCKPVVLQARWPQSAFLLCGLFLLCTSELRSAYVWNHLKQTLTAAPADTQILYLPRLEPLVHLLPDYDQKKRMVTIFEGESRMHNQPRSMLLVSDEASEVCRSAGWNIQSAHGIFSLCDVGQGTLVHLFPLN